MKAAVLTGTEQMVIETRETSVPNSNEVQVRVSRCGICGTDQHIYQGHPGSAPVVPPRILGHELAGTVSVIGKGVTAFQVGDRVTIDPNIYCGTCRFCREGRPHLCEQMQAIGVTRDGGMAEFVNVPAANAYHLPDELTFDQGAMIEPLGCCLHGILQLQTRPGASAVVIGGGYIGLLMVQLLRLYGADPVVVSELDTNKHEAAVVLGAAAVHSPRDGALAQMMGRLTDGGFDIVVECVGRPETMQTAIEVAGRGGQVLLFGVANPMTEISVRPFDVFSKELKISGSFINPNTHEQAISLLKQGKVNVTKMISHRFQLDELPSVMAKFGDLGVTKGIIALD